MVPRSLAVASRMALLRRAQLPVRSPLRSLLPFMLQATRNYADQVVKVPQMAESISEGTLKQFFKQIGEHVEQDEEIATIETDKVREGFDPLRFLRMCTFVINYLSPFPD